MIALFVLAAGTLLAWPAETSAASFAPANQAAAEVIVEVRVHGNQVTPDAEMVALSGVVIGDPFLPTTIARVQERLRETGHFERIQVLKRYTSIADASRIALVIIVDEGPVRLEDPETVGAGSGSGPGQTGTPEPVRVVRRSKW